MLGKRSNFPKIPRDLYETPKEAVMPLLPFIYGHDSNVYFEYYEPCCGNCALVNHLKSYATCVAYSDTELDARTTTYWTKHDFDLFITNPPWSREILHPIIENLTRQKPAWLLLDADWAHTQQSSELIKLCKKIVSVGRVKWIAGSQHTSKDNCAWYYFTDKPQKFAEFYGRNRKG